MNHYNQMILDIGKLISEKKGEEALKIINEELSMPYVPKEIEEILLSYKEELVPTVPQKKVMLSAEEIEKFLLSDDDMIISSAISALGESNVRMHLDAIKKFLMKKNVENILKNSVLDVLIDQGVKELIKVIYSDGTEHVINTSTAERVLSGERITPVLTILDDLLPSIDISLFDISRQLLDIVTLSAYPNAMLEDFNHFALALALKANQMLNYPVEEVELIHIFNTGDKKASEYLRIIDSIVSK